MKVERYIFRFIFHTVLLVGVVVMIGPFIWGLVSAFKTPTEIITIPITFLPRSPTLVNFISLFS